MVSHGSLKSSLKLRPAYSIKSVLVGATSEIALKEAPVKLEASAEQAIKVVIDNIWQEFDVSRTGSLSMAETRKFIDSFLGKIESDDQISE